MTIICIMLDNKALSDFRFSRLFNDKIGKTRSNRTWIQENMKAIPPPIEKRKMYT